MEEQKQMGDEIAEARLYAIRVEYGQAFERTSLEQVKKDGAELIRLGQSILDNANKGFERHNNPNDEAFVKDLFGFKN